MKRYLKDLTKEELKKVFDNNSKIRAELYEEYKERDGEFAQEQYDMFLENVGHYYTYHNNYSSYYLRLNDLEGYNFLNNMHFEDLHDYSIVSDEKIEEIKQVMKSYEDIDYSSEDITDEEIDNLQDKLDSLAKEVLQGIETYLHEIEDYCYSDEELFEELWNIVEDWYGDYYITDDSYIAYRDITQCYK